MKHYDAVIIGSGQGGTPLSKKLAGHGWKTALIEKAQVGGTCVNVGCTPTKTMIASAKTAYLVKNAASYGVTTSGMQIDIETILSRKDKVVESFRSGSEKSLEKTENLDLIFGTASFVDKKRLKVVLNGGGEEEIAADKIFIDVGTRAEIPEVTGLKEVGYYTSATLMELREIPEHLLIIGGGYIGLEFGQMYRRFGSKVTILEHGKRFLPKEDQDVAAALQEILAEEEIEIVTDATVLKVHKSSGIIVATIQNGQQHKEMHCSHILVSAGQIPNADLLHAEAAGISLDEEGYIVVNEQLETLVKDIYAIGDVKGGAAFTHIAYNDYVILYNNLLHGKQLSTQHRLVPYTMFTDPQLGRVGMTEDEARKKGLNIKVAKRPMADVARAIETGDTRGLMKVVVDHDSGQILGVAILGQEGGEVMSVLQMAMTGGITWQQIRDMVFAHPLYAESLNNLFMSLDSDS